MFARFLALIVVLTFTLQDAVVTATPTLVGYEHPLPTLGPVKHVKTDILDIAYYDSGPSSGPTVVLVHGFPYDINAYASVVPILQERGYRTIVPYLRGYAPTKFLSPSTPRDAEPAALGQDIKDLIDQLRIDKVIVAGYDWGTVAVNVFAAFYPERCLGMVAGNSYLLQNHTAGQEVSAPPAAEALRWYFYVLLTPRGLREIAESTKEWARVLWSKNSPQWHFTEAELDRTLPALQNSDFPVVAANFYRFGLNYYQGDGRYAALAERVDAQPKITVPAVTLDPEFSPVIPPQNASFAARFFTGPRIHQIVRNTGENIPQQNPKVFAEAIFQVAQLGRH